MAALVFTDTQRDAIVAQLAIIEGQLATPTTGQSHTALEVAMANAKIVATAQKAVLNALTT